MDYQQDPLWLELDELILRIHENAHDVLLGKPDGETGLNAATINAMAEQAGLSDLPIISQEGEPGVTPDVLLLISHPIRPRPITWCTWSKDLGATMRVWPIPEKLQRTIACLESWRDKRRGQLLTKGVKAESLTEPVADVAGQVRGRLSARELSEKHGVPYHPLRNRLKLWRSNNDRGWIEVSASERGSHDPHFLYEAKAVQSVVVALKEKMVRKKSKQG
jgi:hypothetical protein